MNLIDTHCHLVSEKLTPNAAALIKNAQDQCVKKIINIAYNLETCLRAKEQLALSNMLFCTFGIQPHDASEYTEKRAEQIKQLILNTDKVVGVGEIGLDAHYTLSPTDIQEKCFDHFLNLACELKLPVVIHVRETHKQVHTFLSHYVKKGLTGVIHCFTETKEEMFEFLDLGFYISFSGIVTFKNANNLVQAALAVPKNKLLIETDSPYLAPTPMRGKMNEPSFLIHTCQFLAKQMGISPEEFADQTYDNAHNLFTKLRN